MTRTTDWILGMLAAIALVGLVVVVLMGKPVPEVFALVVTTSLGAVAGNALPGRGTINPPGPGA